MLVVIIGMLAFLDWAFGCGFCMQLGRRSIITRSALWDGRDRNSFGCSVKCLLRVPGLG